MKKMLKHNIKSTGSLLTDEVFTECAKCLVKYRRKIESPIKDFFLSYEQTKNM